MSVIHKQELPVFKAHSNIITLHLPPFARIVRVSRQYPGDPSVFVWYICDPSLPADEAVRIGVFGTGHAFPAKIINDYLGTEIFDNGALVLHFFLMGNTNDQS